MPLGSAPDSVMVAGFGSPLVVTVKSANPSSKREDFWFELVIWGAAPTASVKFCVAWGATPLEAMSVNW
jgi:hypothetical protein